MGAGNSKEKEEKNYYVNVVCLGDSKSISTNMSKSNPDLDGGGAAPAVNNRVNNSGKKINIGFINDGAKNYITINLPEIIQNQNEKENKVINGNINENEIIENVNVNENEKKQFDVDSANSNSITEEEQNNRDNNIGNEYQKPKPNIKEEEGNIDNNIGSNNKKKETTKGSENKEEYNPNFGKGEQQNHKEEKNNEEITKGRNIDNNEGENNKINNKEKMKNTGTFGNPEIDFREKINEYKRNINNPNNNDDSDDDDFNEDDLEISQNVLEGSYSHLNPDDPNVQKKIQLDAIKKIKKGYFPLFFIIDNRKTVFYYVKKDSTLKEAIKYYDKINAISDRGEEYNLYIEGKKVDINTQIKDLKIKVFSRVKNHP